MSIVSMDNVNLRIMFEYIQPQAWNRHNYLGTAYQIYRAKKVIIVMVKRRL